MRTLKGHGNRVHLIEPQAVALISPNGKTGSAIVCAGGKIFVPQDPATVHQALFDAAPETAAPAAPGVSVQPNTSNRLPGKPAG